MTQPVHFSGDKSVTSQLTLLDKVARRPPVRYVPSAF
jgi:hypothetical protein